jgi:endothelin-converting enzyme/putative endopeptidase
MGEETRSRALEKLATFRVKLAYSDRFKDYGALELGNGRLVDVAAAGAAFETDRQIAKIGGPVDRDEWLMLPQRVDAYFNPTLNEICFPAGILTPPQFDADADLAENLGGIGSVIGHEIGHAFDDQGALYDSAGVMRDWWTADDRAAFRARTQSLVAQYDALEPRQLPGERVNGALTLGENIGDLGGIGIALQAYLLGESEGRSDEEVAAGIRRLFLNYALSWRTIWRSEALRKLLASDPHSPPEFRTNVVRNVDAFHDAFATKPGDGLWLAPEDRVRIW